MGQDPQHLQTLAIAAIVMFAPFLIVLFVAIKQWRMTKKMKQEHQVKLEEFDRTIQESLERIRQKNTLKVQEESRKP